MVNNAPHIQKRAAADALHAVGDDDRVQIAALIKRLFLDLAHAVRDDDARQTDAAREHALRYNGEPLRKIDPAQVHLIIKRIWLDRLDTVRNDERI